MKDSVIGVVVGSARRGSFSQAVADAIAGLLPAGFSARMIAVADLPVYNQDYDENSPESYVRFRGEVKGCDAFLFVTPEHNRSFPALLKNALDIASRPYGSNLWSGKPGAIVSVSPGAIGGFGSSKAALQVLSFLNLFLMQQPEMYIGGVADMIGSDGKIANEKTVAFLQQFANSFAAWVDRCRASGAEKEGKE